MRRSTKLVMVLFPIAAGVTGFWFGRAAGTSSSDRATLVQLTKENDELKAALEKLRSAAGTQQDSPGNTQVAPSGQASRVPLMRGTPNADDTEAVRALRDNLAAANQSFADLQARSAQLEAELDQAKNDQKRLADLESDLTGQLASMKRVVEERETELTRKSEQVASLETANKKLAGDAVNAGRKLNQLLETADELQEIYRRRETSLNTLVRRYKEVTEQSRAFASVLENRRGQEGAPGAVASIAGPELARIENSITMAEEELRELNALNAQALRIQKKLQVK